jgi:DnaJ-class molecular chaperone
VHHAPLDEALAWLRERATPGADELPEPAVPEDLAALRQTLSDLISATTGERRERLQNGGHLCPRCGGYGWLRERRERDNGRTASAYAICEACGGEGVVESEERR